MTKGSLMKVESIAECSIGAFFNTSDMYLAMIGLENQFSFYSAAVLHRFHCMLHYYQCFIAYSYVTLGCLF